MKFIVSSLANSPSVAMSLQCSYHTSMLYLLIKLKARHMRFLNFLERVTFQDVTLTESCTARHLGRVSECI